MMCTTQALSLVILLGFLALPVTAQSSPLIEEPTTSIYLEADQAFRQQEEEKAQQRGFIIAGIIIAIAIGLGSLSNKKPNKVDPPSKE